VGRQDVLYGDQGASIYWEGGILAGGVDFIFGGMAMSINKATIVANINGEKGDKCYIAAGRSEGRGLLFYKCHIRLATEDELADISHQLSEIRGKVYLARPWRWWGETVWAYTTWDEGILNPEGWHTGLVKDKEGFNPDNPCPNSYEYKSQDHSVGRPKWVSVLRKPILPDGTKLNPKTWLK
jgi:pectin methylesterase-like acyl-CoA thioesterase